MKPKEHINKLIEAVSDPSRIQRGRVRQIISLSQYLEPMSFILHNGVAAVYRSYDHMLIINAQAPTIIGVNIYATRNEDVYFQARDEIQFEIVPRQHIIDAVQNDNLWESLAHFQMFSTQRLIAYHFSATGVSTYDLIRNSLLALMQEYEELRLATNACDYIQEKTLLSRSGIMKMLGDLKKGGYIDLHRGILLAIHKLPSKY